MNVIKKRAKIQLYFLINLRWRKHVQEDRIMKMTGLFRLFVVFLLAAVPCLPCRGQTVSIDLGETDLEDGLVQTQKEASDGEAEVVECGPADDVRDCKKNWGAEDPTLDAQPDVIWPDGLIYFNVTDPWVKSEGKLRITLTLFDDAALQANTPVSLHYTNDQSTGPADIPNTFFGHPDIGVLAGSDAWITLTWDVFDAGFRTFMQGTSDFRIQFGNGQRVCVDRCEVTVLELVFPAQVACTVSNRTEVTLAWENMMKYDALVIMRDGTEIASLDEIETSYTDVDVSEGEHTYQVVATFGGESDGPSCAVTILPDMTGRSVSVDLAEADVESGLRNSHTAPPDGGDGENEAVLCGPVDDEREARKNWGAEDPTPDGAAGGMLYPDNFIYFTVTDETIKGQGTFRLSVTLYDDPALPADTGLYLQYTNAQSTGPGDIANTFFPQNGPPVRMLGQTDAWITLQWPIENAGFRSFMQGDSDFRLGVTNGSRVCFDAVDLTVGLPDFPVNLVCTESEGNVTLSWEVWRTYDAVTILRNDAVIATLPGDATTYEEFEVPSGEYTYSVMAVYNAEEDGDSCDIVIGTPGIYFIRGDVNDDNNLNLADAVSLLGYLFNDKASPGCQDAADSNDDGDLNLADVIYILVYLFSDGDDFPAPFPECGVDGTPDDDLDECVYNHCL